MSQGKTYKPFFPNLEKFLENPRSGFLEPFSTRAEPWTQWSKLPFGFIIEEFCHQKTFSGKISAKTSRSQIKIKQQVAKKKGQYQIADEVKLWFDLPNNGAFYAKVKSSDYLKVLYDNGLREFKGDYLYSYAAVHSNKLLQSVSARLGLGYVTRNGHFQNRIKAVFQKKQTQYFWYHKSFVAHRDFRFGFLSVFNFTHSVLQKNNFLFGYNFNTKTCAFLRTEVNGFRSTNPNFRSAEAVFDTVTADVIHQVDDKSKAGVQAIFNIRERTLGEAKVVYQYQFDAKRLVKASLSNKFNLAFVAKTPLYGFEESGTVSLGLGVDGATSKNPDFKTGIEINLNL